MAARLPAIPAWTQYKRRSDKQPLRRSAVHCCRTSTKPSTAAAQSHALAPCFPKAPLPSGASPAPPSARGSPRPWCCDYVAPCRLDALALPSASTVACDRQSLQHCLRTDGTLARTCAVHSWDGSWYRLPDCLEWIGMPARPNIEADRAQVKLFDALQWRQRKALELTACGRRWCLLRRATGGLRKHEHQVGDASMLCLKHSS